MYKNKSVLTGVNWLSAGTRGLFCEHSNIFYGSRKRQETRGRDDRLYPSEKCVIHMTILIIQFNLLKPTGHVMHQQFNNQQLYALPTLYLCVLCLSENKQRLVPLTA